MITWRTYYTLENRKRNRAQISAGISEEERVRLGSVNAEQGMTDRSEYCIILVTWLYWANQHSLLANPHFRYELWTICTYIVVWPWLHARASIRPIYFMYWLHYISDGSLHILYTYFQSFDSCGDRKLEFILTNLWGIPALRHSLVPAAYPEARITLPCHSTSYNLLSGLLYFKYLPSLQ